MISQLLALSSITALLAPSALACLELSGSASSGFDTVGDLKAVDNGVQTCSGSIRKGDKNLDCIDGYSLNYDYADNPVEGPFPITYCNPQNCYGIEIPLDCIEENCCGGQTPCLCYSRNIYLGTFC